MTLTLDLHIDVWKMYQYTTRNEVLGEDIQRTGHTDILFGSCDLDLMSSIYTNDPVATAHQK